MASISPSTTTTTATKTVSSVSPNPLWLKPSQLSNFRSNQTRRVTTRISCNASKNTNHDQTTKSTNNVENNMFDRRNMLIGLGGLCGVATTLSGGLVALNKPIDPKQRPTTKPNTPKTPSPHGNGPNGHGRGHGHCHGQGMLCKVKNAKAAVSFVTFPIPLKDVIRTKVQRPVKSRSKKEKEDVEEALIIEVDAGGDVYSKFDVYVNDEAEVPTMENRTKTEYVGSFINVVPFIHNSHGVSDDSMITSVRFGLTELIEDLGADDDEAIDVIFVPRTRTESVVIKDVRVEYLN